MKKLSELKYNQIEKLKKLIREMGFKVSKKQNNKLIFFSKGFREFTLYSTNIIDPEFGLTMSFDLDKFLDKNYKIKAKHSTSLQELIYNKEKSHEEAFKQLNWKVIQYYNFKDFDLYSFNDDIGFESLYEVSIRDLNHIIVDDNVYEGDMNTIISILKANRENIVMNNLSDEFITYINSLNA